jgi:hypothetical protein
MKLMFEQLKINLRNSDQKIVVQISVYSLRSVEGDHIVLAIRQENVEEHENKIYLTATPLRGYQHYFDCVSRNQSSSIMLIPNSYTNTE